MILAVLLDGDGRPVCTEMWPGNTADVGGLVPVVDRLRKRSSIQRVCVVADRGMISAETFAELEARGLCYILGVPSAATNWCETSCSPIPLPSSHSRSPSRARRSTTKPRRSCWPGGVHRLSQSQEMKKDAAARAAILAALKHEFKKGDKTLVGNKGYRRFLATPDDDHFVIDRAKAEEDPSSTESWCSAPKPIFRRSKPCFDTNICGWWSARSGR